MREEPVESEKVEEHTGPMSVLPFSSKSEKEGSSQSSRDGDRAKNTNALKSGQGTYRIRVRLLNWQKFSTQSPLRKGKA